MNDLVVADAVDKNDALMLKVIETGNVEVLERFIALREKEEARHAALEFDKHFAEMQAEFVAVLKAKDVQGKYKYAPLEDIIAIIGPTIARHGFSYSWDESAIEGGGKRCSMRISGHGSSRVNTFDIPPMGSIVSKEGKDTQNPAQVAGSMSTYGRRYTFIAGFGVAIKDEDSDGRVGLSTVDTSDDVATLNAANTIPELHLAWQAVYNKYKGSPVTLREMVAVKDKRKKELS
jgi:hypothetical protein